MASIVSTDPFSADGPFASMMDNLQSKDIPVGAYSEDATRGSDKRTKSGDVSLDDVVIDTNEIKTAADLKLLIEEGVISPEKARELGAKLGFAADVVEADIIEAQAAIQLQDLDQQKSPPPLDIPVKPLAELENEVAADEKRELEMNRNPSVDVPKIAPLELLASDVVGMEVGLDNSVQTKQPPNVDTEFNSATALVTVMQAPAASTASAAFELRDELQKAAGLDVAATGQSTEVPAVATEKMSEVAANPVVEVGTFKTVPFGSEPEHANLAKFASLVDFSKFPTFAVGNLSQTGKLPDDSFGRNLAAVGIPSKSTPSGPSGGMAA